MLVPEARTINFGMDLGTVVRLEPRSTREISVHLKGLGYQKTFSSLAQLLSSEDPELSLLSPVLTYFAPETGFSLTLESQSPLGGGLGGSSSLLVGMIKAFSAWSKNSLSPSEIVRLACNLETRVLGKPAGTQDYISALEGGLNVIHYGDRGPEWTTYPGEELNDRFFLVDTGKPHHSGLNNWEVIKQALDGDAKVLEALRGLAQLSVEFEKSLLAQEWLALPELFGREFAHRVALSSGFSSPEIEQLKDIISSRAGAAVKICGAGGGGCVMVWSDPKDLEDLKELVRNQGFSVLNAKYWARGPLAHATS